MVYTPYYAPLDVEKGSYEGRKGFYEVFIDL